MSPSPQSSQPAIGAVIYPPGKPPEKLLADFAAELAARGFRLGGLLQDTARDETGRKTDMTVTEIDTGRKLSIGQSLGKASKACILDSQALAEASGSVRRAIESHADLLFINKFSKSEMEGEGLAGDMLAAVAEGVPVLTAVPGVLIEEWTEFTGGQTELIAPSMAALWRWWGPGRLYADLANGVEDCPVKRVVVGLNWTMVETATGIGLAQTPERGTPGCNATSHAGKRTQGGLKALAGLVHSTDPFDQALGMAACNAHYNRSDLRLPDGNGLESFGAKGGGTVVIGAFPGIHDRLPGAKVIDRKPAPGQYPEQAAEWLLPAAEAAIITASTLANRSLPGLLRLARFARVALVGPGAPLTDRLFTYGIEVSSGLVAEDPDGLARAVAEGGGAKDLKRHCRQATARKAAP
ncbi:conserved protein of unknown function(Protein of unknown function DUF2478,12-170;Domain of unknown function DUF4213,176-261;Protein of unknown function DUF364,279-403) [Magnetospirillum sp. XM-1]|uniref:DUF2478 domain-containing protein n=1 Tax=Magnetospirillum sp. XM-1 TaxID=1663591 RepID=UPI00073DD025|nr:DUF2478 domain-containing protein [Magnetospirillum sp. XM-1]CUW38117.1 conserved protein of unknown function(Protein of unknown function DUF2478,12-170;Domain of unknown function DUF4213,176-261;Protein of unknown function DUF364,279-403) [Magnetospirillum sp. XM-1]